MTKRRILIFIIWSTLCFNAVATSYFVSNKGNDNNSGLSMEYAWQTLAKVNSMKLIPGDKVLFKCGDTWRGRINIPSSGSEANHVVFASYGSGAKPKLINSKKSFGWSIVSGNIWTSETVISDPYKSSQYTNHYFAEIFFENTDGTVIWGNPKKASKNDLNEEFDWTWESGHLFVYSPSDPNERYGSVEAPQGDIVVYLNGKDYITIADLDIRYFILAGIKAKYAVDYRSGLEVKNCQISYGGIRGGEVGYGISSWYSNSWYHNNVIHDVGRRGIDVNAIISGQIEENVIIENNEIYGCHHTGIDLSSGVSPIIRNITIRGNYIYDLEDYPFKDFSHTMLGIYSANTVPGTIENVYIYNNVFKNVSRIDITLKYVDKAYLYNNTIYAGRQIWNEGMVGRITLISSKNAVIKNNIIYHGAVNDGNPNQYGLVILPNCQNVKVDNNLYYSTDPSNGIVQYMGETYKMIDFERYQKESGQDQHSPDPSDPLFINAERSDFHLQSASPAISTGTYVKIPTDCEGLYYNNPPSIGAHEANPGDSALAEETREIIFYPNPTKGDITVKVAGAVAPVRYQMKVKNMLGTEIFSDMLEIEESGTPLSFDLVPGVYLFQLISGGRIVANKKFVVI